MKKSIFNIFRKIKENIYIVFNSNSLAIAEADEIFQKIYNNLDNLNLNKFSAEEKEVDRGLVLAAEKEQAEVVKPHGEDTAKDEQIKGQLVAG